MANENTTQYTHEEWRKLISEILEIIDDLEYTKMIYSIVYGRMKRPRDRGQEECPKS